MKQILVLLIFISTSNVLYGQKENCKCFNGIGSSENDKPSLIAEYENGISLSVCGYEIEKKSESEIIISEFNIFNCKTRESLAEYGAVLTCNVKIDSGKLLITELIGLHAGEDWKWQLVPFSQEQISAQNNKVIFSSPKFVYEKTSISKLQVDQLIKEVESLKGKGYNKRHDLIMNKLTYLALNGNSVAKNIIINFNTYFNCTPDGALAEQWSDAIWTISWVN